MWRGETFLRRSNRFFGSKNLNGNGKHHQVWREWVAVCFFELFLRIAVKIYLFLVKLEPYFANTKLLSCQIN